MARTPAAAKNEVAASRLAEVRTRAERAATEAASMRADFFMVSIELKP
jgi:hypothetical protein